ncbi:MAG: hypothetical protein H0T79_08885 [Deltaproteobacteria bacterium]|nr:hypothetical protein [Deltaproteobacteria bacterium]
MRDRTFATIIALTLVIVAAGSRVIPHPWNFTPMIAVALFGGARINRGWLAGLAVIGCLALGDLALGYFPYGGMEWVYGSMLLVVVMGRMLRTRTSLLATLVMALGTGAVFFIITNLGVFLGGALYPRTLAGLGECYVAALPFYRNQIVGDIAFSGALFGLYSLALTMRRGALAPA